MCVQHYCCTVSPVSAQDSTLTGQGTAELPYCRFQHAPRDSPSANDTLCNLKRINQATRTLVRKPAVQEPGRPLFVSLLLYLDGQWRREWDAETLFLDSHADVGILVRPRSCRCARTGIQTNLFCS